VHELAQELLHHIRREKLLFPGRRVGVAVSGGADSVALLRLLLELRRELGIVLSVVHFNHKLRGQESDEDESFVADLARSHKLQFHSCAADVASYAAEEHISIETAARRLRYQFFYRLLGNETQDGTLAASGSPPPEKPIPMGRAPRLDNIATGHTLDDQAETVLMRVIRGTGLRGLGGIHPRIQVGPPGSSSHPAIIRPLLHLRRRDLEACLNNIGQPWREDPTNRELKFTRNRVRHTLLPLLQREFNPAIAEGLGELAQIAREEEDYWESHVAALMSTLVQWSQPNVSLNLTRLLAEPLALQRRVIKSIGERAGFPLDYKHIHETLRFAAEETDSGKQLALPLGWHASRTGDALVFKAPDPQASGGSRDYEYRLPVPGRVYVPESGSRFEAVKLGSATPTGECCPDHLYDFSLLAKELTVRNWRAGDRFWPAHTKSPRKVKELLQERHIPQPERKLWPVVLSGDEIVWVRGFPPAANFRAREGGEAALIREVAEAGMTDSK
jgi:tRNA(Ile)-lysidine synthase